MQGRELQASQLNIAASGFGEDVVAAITVSSKISAIAYMIVIGWGQGFQPVCAMNYGAKQYDRVKKAFKYTVKAGTIFLIISSICLYIFAKFPTMALSRNNEIIEISVIILRLQCLSLPLMGYFATSSMLMQNTGRYYLSLIISISRQGIFYIPLLFLLPLVFGQWGIYLIQPLSDIAAFILAMLMVKNSNIWKVFA